MEGREAWARMRGVMVVEGDDGGDGGDDDCGERCVMLNVESFASY